MTSLDNGALLEAAKLKGAFAALQKDFTSCDDLANAVLKAMAAVPVNGKKAAAASPTPSGDLPFLEKEA